MPFRVEDLAAMLSVERQDQGWGIVVGCGPRSLGLAVDEGCPNTQRNRVEAVDAIWGLRSLDDLRALRFNLAVALDVINQAIQQEEPAGAEEGSAGGAEPAAE
jgi:hypothetical protein